MFISDAQVEHRHDADEGGLVGQRCLNGVCTVCNRKLITFADRLRKQGLDMDGAARVMRRVCEEAGTKLAKGGLMGRF